jgi:catechol 2,3-dioxygenase-like lactoylglutathione lyase family enzyme
MTERVHHTAIIASDIERSLRFYRDGIGLEVLSDIPVLESDWPTVMGVRSTRARSLNLGDPKDPSAGVLELLEFEGGSDPAPPVGVPTCGMFLVSFLGVDVDAIIERLHALGYEPYGRIEGRAPTAVFDLATVRDPDGVLVELVGVPRPI